MREIPLTQGRIALVDDEDFDLVNQFRWRWMPPVPKHAGVGYAGTKSAPVIMMHHLVAGQSVDHRDRNGLNNQRANLRRCTGSQNAANRQFPLTDSGYRGVRQHGAGWRARIRVNYKGIHLGSFATPEEAAIVYNQAATHYFGEFAVLNDVGIQSIPKPKRIGLRWKTHCKRGHELPPVGSVKVRHCSKCRNLASKTKRLLNARVRPCVVCSSPLVGNQSKYCSENCQKEWRRSADTSHR